VGTRNAERIHCASVPSGRCCIGPCRHPGISQGDVLAVEFWNDPDVSVHTLPTGVELDERCPGHSVAPFSPTTSSPRGTNEYLDPARYQCRGFSVLLDAIWKGTRIAWCPYCYVDKRRCVDERLDFKAIRESSVPYTRPVRLPLGAWLRHPSLAHDSRFLCLHVRSWSVAGASPCYHYAKRPSALLACSTAGLWEGDIFRGSPSACTTSQLSMSSFDASRTTSRLQTSGSARCELNFPEAYVRRVGNVGAAEGGGADIDFSFSYSVTDIEILADLAALQSRLMPTNALWIAAGINKSNALQSNQLWLVSVAYSVPKVIDASGYWKC